MLNRTLTELLPKLENLEPGQESIAKKPKKRYWQWKFRNNQGRWFRCSSYLDENGIATDTGFLDGWEELIDKIKIEDDFVEL